VAQLCSRIAAAEGAVGGSNGAARQFGLPGPGDGSNLRILVKLKLRLLSDKPWQSWASLL
jgi:hypothetical protein